MKARPWRGFHALALVAAVLAGGRVAWAKPNAIAVYVEGPDADAVRDELATALPEGATLVAADGFTGALADQGQAGPFHKKLDGANHGTAVKRLRAAASASGARAVIVGRVTKEKARHRVRLLLIEAAGSEEILGDVTLEGDSHDDARVASVLGPALEPYKTSRAAGKTAAPDHERGAAEEVAPVGDRSPDAIALRPTGLEARSLLDVSLGGKAAARNFVYSDGITANLRSYNVLPAAMFTVNAELFPLAGASGVLRDIGFTGAFSRSLFLESSMPGGASTSTTETSYVAGLRVRIHPGGDAGPILGISDAYASQSFAFGATGGALASEIPSVAYTANRTAVDVRIPAGKLALLAEAGFRAVLDAGPVAQRFRSASVEGIDAEVGGAFAVAPGWEMRLVADYQRYFYSFAPVPGDAYVAGGALDQFFGARLALAWIY
jgi:hypothetical protein